MVIAAVPVFQFMSFLAAQVSPESANASRRHAASAPRSESRRDAALQDYLANYERWEAEETAERERWETLSLEDKMKEND